MTTDDESFKKPADEGQQTSSPAKRYSFSSEASAATTGHHRPKDNESDYGSESGSKAAGSTGGGGGAGDTSLAANRQYYEQQLNYYQNNPMTGRETVCVFCLTRCSSKERRPQLLACLHSACYDCFKVCFKLRPARLGFFTAACLDSLVTGQWRNSNYVI